MNKITIYTNENCPYCKAVKEELNKNNIEFTERLTSDWKKTWNQISDLTGMSAVPTIHYDEEYFVPARDFGNPQGLINLLSNHTENNLFDYSRRAFERIKTLNYNTSMAFMRTDQILRQIENKLNTEENEHKSTN